MMRYSVDRVEPCGCVVLVSETGEQRKFSKDAIGFLPNEGDVLLRGEDGSFSLDADETATRRKRLNALLQRLVRRKR